MTRTWTETDFICSPAVQLEKIHHTATTCSYSLQRATTSALNQHTGKIPKKVSFQTGILSYAHQEPETVSRTESNTSLWHQSSLKTGVQTTEEKRKEAKSTQRKRKEKPAWWHPPVIPALGVWRLKDQEFKASSGYIVNWRPA